jgi:hypothetical protein
VLVCTKSAVDVVLPGMAGVRTFSVLPSVTPARGEGSYCQEIDASKKLNVSVM